LKLGKGTPSNAWEYPTIGLFLKKTLPTPQERLGVSKSSGASKSQCEFDGPLKPQNG